MTEHKIKTERFDQKRFKEDMLAESDKRFAFKEHAGFQDFKDRVNDVLRTHFDQKAFEKEQKRLARDRGKSRFDKRVVKKKKLIGLFSEFVLKLGYESTAQDINSTILRFTVGVNIVLSLVILAFVLINNKSLDVFILFMILIWTLMSAALYLLSALVVFLYLDLKMYQNVLQIEESLPDFLQLASANISAGMTVDRALWYAIRPKFGVLATEMESVAKATIAGEDLEKALSKLGMKYDSRMLKETINLIVEGIQSGGEMAELLNKLSTNIKETQLMRKEISASVTTYSIFIGVATVLAAPILFALSTQLLIIIQNIFSTIQIDKSVGVGSMFSFNFSGESISISNFRKFAILVLVISSFFSAAIISVIRKGSVKDGLKTIPIFIAVSILLYYAATKLFAVLMGGLF